MKTPYILVSLLAAGIACFSVVDVIYFQTSGYDIAFITKMISVFNLAVALAELPFAILFDKYSIKASLYIGFTIRILAFWIFAQNFGASSFIFAQALAGIATAATSGTTVSLVLNEVKEKSYGSMAAEGGRLTLISGLGSIVGGVVGALCFSVSPSWIWYSAIGFFVCGMLTLVFFRDKPSEGAEEPLGVLVKSWLQIFRHRSTYLLVLCNASAIGPIILWQIKFDSVSLWFVVLGFFIITTSSTVGSWLFAKLKLANAKVVVVASMNVIAAVAFAVSDQPLAIALTFSLHVVAHVMLSIQLNGRFHADVDNKIRASASSMISLSDSMLVAICAPVIGIITDTYGVVFAIVVSAALYVSIAALSIALGNTPTLRANDN